MVKWSEKLEGNLTPLLIQVLGMKRLARLSVSQGLKQLGKERGDWLAGLIENQDQNLMAAAWRQTMAFDSRRRLAEIRCPTLIIAGAKDEAVPMHHAHMLHDGIHGSQLVVVDGADHGLVFTHPDEFLRVTDAFLEA